MPVIRINARGTCPEPHSGTMPWDEQLATTDTGTGPVVVMIHGYKYRPGDAARCPHRHILALRPDDLPYRSPSWPRQLGFGAGYRDEGLAIAFGWQAHGALWAAKRRATDAGRALARVLAHLHDQAPARPIHLMAHSLGDELCMEALQHLPAGAVRRIVAMTGASYHARVTAALATPTGRRVELINVTSRENDLFEAMFEWLIAPPRRGDRAIGLRVEAPNAVTVQIDCARTLHRLEQMGLPLGPPQRRVCHWSSYTRPGIMRFYNAILRQPEVFGLARLRQSLPEMPAPRWSRLLALPRVVPLYPGPVGNHPERP